MPDRRAFLRNLVTLPLIGGGVTLIGAPSTPVPLAQVAAVPGIGDPRQRALYAWTAFSAAMGDLAAGADGWSLDACEKWTPLPGPYPSTGSLLRPESIHYVPEPLSPRSARTILVEQRRAIDLGDGRRGGWA